MRPVERVLSVVGGEDGPNGNGEYVRLCPAHDDHNTPNLYVKEGKDGQALVICRAGCDQDQILAALEERGVRKADLFARPNGKGGGGASILQNRENGENPRAHQENGESDHSGCTVAAYAEYVQLPEDYLRERFALRDLTYMGAPAMSIPYPDETGAEQSKRYRLKLHKGAGVDVRFKWRKGDKTQPYGLWNLPEAREKGYVVLVEGESDKHTLSYHVEPGVGITGANTWKDEWADYFEGIPKVYVVTEPDQGGDALWGKLACSPLKERLYRVMLPEGVEDVSALHKADLEGFSEVFHGCLDSAVAWMDMAHDEEAARSAAAWEGARSWRSCPTSSTSSRRL